MSIEALAMLGVDYTKVEVQVVVDEPWLDDNRRQLMEIAEDFDLQPDENAMMRREVKSGQGNTFPSIEFERYDGHGENGERIDTADGDDRDKCMKIKLRQWARAVASYVILLDTAFKYPSAGVT